MTWNTHQQHRLAAERALLQASMPGFEFVDPTGATTVEGGWHSSLSTHYHIVVALPAGFPDECPTTYIAWPSPLRGASQDVEAYGSSHAMHTWESDRPGWTKICTFHPHRWHSDYTLENVLHKAMLWIEAYEAHVASGLPVASFLLEAR